MKQFELISKNKAAGDPAPKRAVLPRLAAGKRNDAALLVTGQAPHRRRTSLQTLSLG